MKGTYCPEIVGDCPRTCPDCADLRAENSRLRCIQGVHWPNAKENQVTHPKVLEVSRGSIGDYNRAVVEVLEKGESPGVVLGDYAWAKWVVQLKRDLASANAELEAVRKMLNESDIPQMTTQILDLMEKVHDQMKEIERLRTK